MKIIPLSEGTFTVDKTKVFVPFKAEDHALNERPTGSLLVEVQPFVIITANDILLLDTGIGIEENGKLQIHENLQKQGIEPGQVTKVLLSHLHKDHAGGISRRDRLGHVSLAFTNAKYYVQQQELDLALETGMPSFLTDDIAILDNNGKVELLHGDGVIDDYIRYQVTGGHSQFHQVFWIEDEGEIAFFGGDEAPAYGQMKRRFAAKYDYDGKKANELRQQWWEQGQKENWHFLFYHDVKRPVWPDM